MEKIQWVDWSAEAFEKARKEDKLILLDIGAVWCHWCHVMDQEAYSNPEIIKTVNEKYLPIRVDNDERPDVNERYNQGGWPTTVVMTPDGVIVHGATYLPTESMKDLLEKCRTWYDQNRDRAAEAAAEVTRRIAEEAMRPAGPAGEVKDYSGAIIETIKKNADNVHGGFGTTQKFPYPGAISLALSEHFRAGDSPLLEFVEKTLRNMADGLIDHEEGGLFRYSVTRDWKTPHYEKNLDVNAACLRNYLDAYRVTGKKEFAAAAESIIDYFLKKLSDPEAGGFYGSQDADIFDEEKQKILMDGEDFFRLSLDERKKHGTPYIDETIYTNWNALMVSSFLDAYHALGREDCRDFALKTLELLMEHCFTEEYGTYHHLRNGKPEGPGLLADGVSLARANLDAYETTADGKYLDAAVRLMRIVENRLGARNGDQHGGYYDSVPDPKMPAATRVRQMPLNENALAVETLARLAAYTANTDYADRAKAVLAAFEENIEAMLARDTGYFASDYAVAAQYVNGSAASVVIIGKRIDPHALELLGAAKRAYRPAKTVQLLDADQDVSSIQARGFNTSDIPAAYVCKNKTCEAPITSPKELERAFEAF